MATSRTPRQNRRDGEPVVVPIRRGGISDARRYTPRGRTVRDAAGQRGTDPYRPALKLVDGGTRESGDAAPERTAGRGGAASKPAASGRGTGSNREARNRDTPRSGASGRGGQQGASARGGQQRGAGSRAGQPRGAGSRGGQPRGAGSRGGSGQRGKPARGAATGRRPAPRARQGTRAEGLAPARRRDRRRVRLGNPMRRLRFGTVLVLALFAVITGRLVELQLTDAAAYAADGLKQRLRPMVLPAPRGAILDRSGAVLAHSVAARYVYADPEMVADVKRTAAKLSPVLGVAKSVLAGKLRRSVRDDGRPVRFVYLARGVSVAVGERVEKLNLMGIGVHRDERREVPGHDLAANVIGFTGSDGDGLAGIEARYDDVLRGIDGERVDELGANGVPIPDGHHSERPARPGSSVKLTIDQELQYEAQRLLAAKLREVKAAFGSALVLDVRTGEVLAMASWPSYDAADPYDADRSRWVDLNTAAVVEPGSTHKPFVIGAALEEGVIGPDSTPVVPPRITKGGATYQDTHWHDTRRMTIPGILAHSSNVGTIQIADQLGAERLCAYQKRFGLGTPTGLELPGEAAGIVQPPDRWSGSSHGSIPIGLGVAATPLQMAAGYAAIANDGVWVQPSLVRGVVGPDGELDATPPGDKRRVLSPDTARELRTAMEAVTTAKDATGLAAAIPGYRVAGKTGTGKRVEDNRYVPGDVTSFVGMAPADAPRFVVAVFAHVPHGGGGGVAAPVFRDVMTAALQRYAVPPSGSEAPRFRVYA